MTYLLTNNSGRLEKTTAISSANGQKMTMTTTVTWKVCGQYPGVSLAQPRVASACRAYVVADGMERLGLDSDSLYWVMRVATYTGYRH